jgi:Holliday junction resolvasome RuvABC endonuclease subunit
MLIIADMKRLFVFNYNPYLSDVKAQVNNVITIKTIWETDFLKTLKNIVIECVENTIFESGIDIAAVENLFFFHNISF